MTQTQNEKDTKVGVEANASTLTSGNNTPVTPVITPVAEQPVNQVKETKYFYFGQEVSLGSRKVVIKLVPKFSILPKDPNAQFIRDEVTKKIGSTWKAGTKDIIRGLSAREAEFYLPAILGVRKESEQWNEKVKEYWANFVIEIPNDTKGVELEVGFKLTSLNIPDSNVEPINLEDYIKFQFAKEHSSVATTPEQLDNMFIHTYYVIDKGLEIEKEQAAYQGRRLANKLFNTLIESKDEAAKNKIDWILETVGGPKQLGINVDNLSSAQKELELEKTMNQDLSRFIEIVEDKHLATKALLRKAIGYGLILQDGNSYFIENKVIGSSQKEAIGYLENTANQKDKLLIIERLKSYRK